MHLTLALSHRIKTYMDFALENKFVFTYWLDVTDTWVCSGRWAGTLNEVIMKTDYLDWWMSSFRCSNSHFDVMFRNTSKLTKIMQQENNAVPCRFIFTLLVHGDISQRCCCSEPMQPQLSNTINSGTLYIILFSHAKFMSTTVQTRIRGHLDGSSQLGQSN